MQEPDSTERELLNSCQDRTNVSVCLEIRVKNKDTSVQQMSYI
jgi:hypothetical protein